MGVERILGSTPAREITIREIKELAEKLGVDVAIDLRTLPLPNLRLLRMTLQIHAEKAERQGEQP